MDINQLVQTIALGILPILFAITLHEAAHGYAARHFGDMTAHQEGRISLNPARHIDPIGTIVLPLITLAIGGILFGWAKPVPVNFNNLRNPKKDMMWVALAGPASNLLMAIGWAILLQFALANPDNYFAKPLSGMAVIGININLILLVLNMLPLPPLDGGRVAVSLLPHKQAWQLSRLEPYGLVILIVMVLLPFQGTTLLSWILSPLIGLAFDLVAVITGLS